MFVAVDAVLAVRALGRLRDALLALPRRRPGALRVEVTARQWAWTFRTAGPDGRFATPDDVVTLGELHVPVGRPIYLKLRSKDVIHSLYLPNFRTKLDAIPGSTTRLWFEADRSPGATRSAAPSTAASATTRCAACSWSTARGRLSRLARPRRDGQPAALRRPAPTRAGTGRPANDWRGPERRGGGSGRRTPSRPSPPASCGACCSRPITR